MPAGTDQPHRPRPHVRRALAVTAALALAPAVAASPAGAATETVDVRVEGATQTLFEGPLATDGHRVKIASDATWRRCDGSNGGSRQAVGAVPTAAAYDAMRILGQDLDGYWHAGFDDFFLERIGPDRREGTKDWGVLVNDVFTPVGGCQWRVRSGDRVLWAFDAFSDRPLLRLTAADGGVAPVTVTLGEPLTVTVLTGAGAAPQAAPAGDVPVAPVVTDAAGVQTSLVDDPATVRTGADGRATIAFAAPGWHRLKAGDYRQVRSNRLDVCVRASVATDCGAPPPDTLVRTPPPLPPDDSPRSGDVPPGRTGDTPTPGGGARDGPAPKLRLPAIVADGRAEGRVGVRWKVLSRGVGVRGWAISARTLPRGGWKVVARGRATTSARLRLPAGVTSQLRIAVTDALGRTTTASFGRVVVPRDDRALRAGRGWSRGADRGAWLKTVTRGGAGATLRLRLPAGRPTVVLRAAGRAARIGIEHDGRRELFAVAASRRPVTRIVTGRARRRAGTVVVRVLAGRVAVDGVAVQP